MNVIVKYLSLSTTKQQVLDHFKEFEDDIRDVNLFPTDQEGVKVGLIEFSSRRTVHEAIRSMSGSILNKRQIQLCLQEDLDLPELNSLRNNAQADGKRIGNKVQCNGCRKQYDTEAFIKHCKVCPYIQRKQVFGREEEILGKRKKEVQMRRETQRALASLPEDSSVLQYEQEKVENNNSIRFKTMERPNSTNRNPECAQYLANRKLEVDLNENTVRKLSLEDNKRMIEKNLKDVIQIIKGPYGPNGQRAEEEVLIFDNRSEMQHQEKVRSHEACGQQTPVSVSGVQTNPPTAQHPFSPQEAFNVEKTGFIRQTTIPPAPGQVNYQPAPVCQNLFHPELRQVYGIPGAQHQQLNYAQLPGGQLQQGDLAMQAMLARSQQQMALFHQGIPTQGNMIHPMQMNNAHYNAQSPQHAGCQDQFRPPLPVPIYHHQGQPINFIQRPGMPGIMLPNSQNLPGPVMPGNNLSPGAAIDKESALKNKLALLEDEVKRIQEALRSESKTDDVSLQLNEMQRNGTFRDFEQRPENQEERTNGAPLPSDNDDWKDKLYDEISCPSPSFEVDHKAPAPFFAEDSRQTKEASYTTSQQVQQYVQDNLRVAEMSGGQVANMPMTGNMRPEYMINNPVNQHAVQARDVLPMVNTAGMAASQARDVSPMVNTAGMSGLQAKNFMPMTNTTGGPTLHDHTSNANQGQLARERFSGKTMMHDASPILQAQKNDVQEETVDTTDETVRQQLKILNEIKERRRQELESQKLAMELGAQMNNDQENIPPASGVNRGALLNWESEFPNLPAPTPIFNQNLSTKPVQGIQKPVQGIQKPIQGIQKPVQEIQKPVQGIQKPVQGIQNPVQGIQKPVQGEQKLVEVRSNQALVHSSTTLGDDEWQTKESRKSMLVRKMRERIERKKHLEWEQEKMRSEELAARQRTELEEQQKLIEDHIAFEREFNEKEKKKIERSRKVSVISEEDLRAQEMDADERPRKNLDNINDLLMTTHDKKVRKEIKQSVKNITKYEEKLGMLKNRRQQADECRAELRQFNEEFKDFKNRQENNKHWVNKDGILYLEKEAPRSGNAGDDILLSGRKATAHNQQKDPRNKYVRKAR